MKPTVVLHNNLRIFFQFCSIRVNEEMKRTNEIIFNSLYLVLGQRVSRLPTPVGGVQTAEGDGRSVVVPPEEHLARRVSQRYPGRGHLEVREHGAEDGAAVHEVPDGLFQRRRAGQRVDVHREQVEDVASGAQLQ